MSILNYLCLESTKMGMSEEIYHGFDFDGYYRKPTYVEIFKNPTFREIESVKKADLRYSTEYYKGGNVRLGVVGENLFAWVASCLHDDAIEHLKHDGKPISKWDLTFIYVGGSESIISNMLDVSKDEHTNVMVKLFRALPIAEYIVDRSGNVLVSRDDVMERLKSRQYSIEHALHQ